MQQGAGSPLQARAVGKGVSSSAQLLCSAEEDDARGWIGLHPSADQGLGCSQVLEQTNAIAPLPRLGASRQNSPRNGRLRRPQTLNPTSNHSVALLQGSRLRRQEERITAGFSQSIQGSTDKEGGRHGSSMQ